MATWVLVDDFDPAISYSGPWTSTQSESDSVSSEIAFENSAHALPSNVVNSTVPPASFSYSYTGSKVAVYGISAFFNLSVPDTSLPEWQCVIDDNTVLRNGDPYHAVLPLPVYCEVDALSDDSAVPDGLHTLAFRVNQSGAGLLFDYLTYLPSPGDKVPANATGWIDSSDSRMVYGSGWANGTLDAAFFTSSESKVPFTEFAWSMNYNGSSVTWYGLSKAALQQVLPDLQTSINTTTTPGYYQVDGGPRTAFTVDLSSQFVAPVLNPWNTILFKTPTTAPGPHNLTVFYDGNSTVFPLTIDHLTIENAFEPGPSPSSKKGAIVGGVVGGVLGGILVILLGLFAWRQWRVYERRHKRDLMAANMTINDIKLHPFTNSGVISEGPAAQYPFSRDANDKVAGGHVGGQWGVLWPA